ncbi:hypothetical protein GQ42DRAFT_160245 [Ramicandelaber brevisporus]|nr:hypothetical protein GQ42DRAFT_160245 [Ramicandelaber brevisporus]
MTIDFAKGYKGYSRLNRLEYLAALDKQLGTDVLLEVQRYIVEELRNTTSNTAGYAKAVYKYNVLLEHCQVESPSKFAEVDSIDLDQPWIDATRATVARELTRLQDLVRALAKDSSRRDELRIAQRDMGNIYFETGDFTNAIKMYQRTRDLGTEAQHSIEMYLDMIKTGFVTDNTAYVSVYLQKLETVVLADEDPNLLNAMHSIRIINALRTREYESAIGAILKLKFDTDEDAQCRFFLAPETVALYGSVLALAMLSRDEIISQIFEAESPDFTQFLELEPSAKGLLESFKSSYFSETLAHLNEIRRRAYLDRHLTDCIDQLSRSIRNKVLITYTAPYKALSLDIMSAELNIPFDTLLKELADLIGDEHIKMRIDSHNRILRERVKDERNQAYSAALEISANLTKYANALTLRTALNNAKIRIPDPQALIDREKQEAIQRKREMEMERHAMMGGDMFGGFRSFGGGGFGGRSRMMMRDNFDMLSRHRF